MSEENVSVESGESSNSYAMEAYVNDLQIDEPAEVAETETVETADATEPEAGETTQVETPAQTTEQLFDRSTVDNLLKKYEEFKYSYKAPQPVNAPAEPKPVAPEAPKVQTWQEKLGAYTQEVKQAYLADLQLQYQQLAEEGRTSEANAIAKVINQRAVALEQHLDAKRQEFLEQAFNEREQSRVSEIEQREIAAKSSATINKVAEDFGGVQQYNKLVIGTNENPGYGRPYIEFAYAQYLDNTGKPDTVQELQSWYKKFTSNEANVRQIASLALKDYYMVNQRELLVGEAKTQLSQQQTVERSAPARRPAGTVTRQAAPAQSPLNSWLNEK